MNTTQKYLIGNINLILIFGLLFQGCAVSGTVTDYKKNDASEFLKGHWVLDAEKFEEGLNTIEPKEGQTMEEFQFGLRMVTGMFSDFYIKFSDNTFEEFNPMGETATGTWMAENGVLVRDYNMNEMIKKSLEMMDRYKPTEKDYDSEGKYNKELASHEKDIEDILKVLHQESPYTLDGDHLLIMVTNEGPRGESMIIPFHLTRAE